MHKDPPTRSVTLPTPSHLSAPILSVHFHQTATDLLLAAGYILETSQMAANMILSYAVEQQNEEGHGKRVPTIAESESWWRRQFQRPTQGPLGHCLSVQVLSPRWYFSLWSHDNDGNRRLDFVVSCIGIKPVFVFTPRLSSDLSTRFLERRMSILAQRMKQVIPARRVFAIFGHATVVEALASAWSAQVGHTVQRIPLYEATYTFCTRRTLSVEPDYDPEHSVGKALGKHVEQVAVLFKDFAEDTAYPLSIEEAREEAAQLISRGQLYIYETYDRERAAHEVASLVAVTRESNNIAAISKVFTAAKWRRRGFAERLVAYTCRRVLEVKQRVVLYVADGNRAANVYGRVGFVGVGRRSFDEDLLVEHWVELGIDDTDPGHW